MGRVHRGPDLLDVLRPQIVLVLALAELAVGVDEQDLPVQVVRLVLVEHEDAGRDAGPVEQLGRQADDGLQNARAVA